MCQKDKALLALEESINRHFEPHLELGPAESNRQVYTLRRRDDSMKRVRYTKFTGDLSSSFGLEDLMEALSEFFLDSGFNDPYSSFQEFNEQTLENLRDAIRRALESGELFDDEAQ